MGMHTSTLATVVGVLLLVGYAAANFWIGLSPSECVWTTCRHGWLTSDPPKFRGAVKATYNGENRDYNITKTMWGASDHEANLLEYWGNPAMAVTGFKIVTGRTSGGDIEFQHPGKKKVYKEIHVACLYSGDGVMYPAVFKFQARKAFVCGEPYAETEGAVW